MDIISDREAALLMVRFIGELDKSAFDQIVNMYRYKSLAVAFKILGDSALAEDVVQEAFLRVIRRRSQYDPKKSFSSWFFTILRNVAIDSIRKNRRSHETLEKYSRMQDINTSKQKDLLDIEPENVLNRLPDGEREVLILRILYDMPFKDIADSLDIAANAARKRAQRGLCRLRQLLKDGEIVLSADGLRGYGDSGSGDDNDVTNNDQKA